MQALNSPLVWCLPRPIWRHLVRRWLGACGDQVTLPRNGNYTFRTLFLGNCIRIGSRPCLWAVHSRIVIRDKVITGPELMIMAGNHNVTLRGKYMTDATERDKTATDDQDVIIEEDVWIGARATLLKGVTVGRGAVIGAGAVVTRSVPPYTIAAGNPARPLKARGTLAEMLRHEQTLYPSGKRLSESCLRDAVRAVEMFVPPDDIAWFSNFHGAEFGK